VCTLFLRYESKPRIDREFNDGELADIEMTISPQAFETLRVEFYVCRLFTTQDIRGTAKHYRDLKHTYHISFLNKNLFADDVLVREFTYYDGAHNLSLDGKTRIITVELNKIARIAEAKTVDEMSGEERWAAFFYYRADKKKRELVNRILEKEEAIAMAAEKMLEFTEQELEWYRIESKLKYELDMRATIGEKREAEKSRKEKLAIARNLKQRLGLSDEQITELMSVPPKARRKLKAKNRKPGAGG
jgi:hypothetical protein